jgi:hypothetical protein
MIGGLSGTLQHPLKIPAQECTKLTSFKAVKMNGKLP